LYNPLLIEDYCYMKAKWDQCLIDASEEKCHKLMKEYECDDLRMSDADCDDYIYYERYGQHAFKRGFKKLTHKCNDTIEFNVNLS
jgi:hypothetical protein